MRLNKGITSNHIMDPYIHNLRSHIGLLGSGLGNNLPNTASVSYPFVGQTQARPERLAVGPRPPGALFKDLGGWHHVALGSMEYIGLVILTNIVI